MTNPYEAPQTTPIGQRGSPGSPPPPQDPGLAGHIRVVAVLMMIQGFFELTVGAVVTVMAFIFPRFLAAALAADPEIQAEGGPDPQQAVWFMTAVYLIMGLAGVIPGILHLTAGLRNLYYKGRILGVAALGLGMLTAPMVMCLPTAVILMVYGLIVYLNSSSAAAFAMGQRGYSAEAIYTTFFAPRPPG